MSGDMLHHIIRWNVEKMVARLTASKTMSESGMEAMELIEKALYIIGRQFKGRQLIEVSRSTANR
jgi:hypothetical protein